MDQRAIYSNLRRMIGGNSVLETSERDLEEYLVSASDWLVGELQNAYRLEEQMWGLTADVGELPLPADLAWILFVEWNGNRLTPSSHFQWDRVGTDYRGATSGTPAEFAVLGRRLLLSPPPSSTAITTDASLTVKHVVTTLEIGAGGIAELGDSDTRLMLWRAAWEYHGLHPSEEGAVRMVFCEKQIASLLPAARDRANRPIMDQSPQWYPQISRRGAAR